MSPLHVAELRAKFPVLDQMTHLASCSIAARSTDLDRAMGVMLDDLSGRAPWPAFERRVEEARRRFAALIGADPDQIALIPNVSIAAHQIASALCFRRRPEVLLSRAEFPGVAQALAGHRRRGARLHWIGTPGRLLTTADFTEAIGHRTALVSVPAVTYQSGQRLPVPDIAAVAHAAGARVFVDAYQSAGVEPIRVRNLGCDYLAAGTGKYLLGLPGVAFLYARHPDGLAPMLTGWRGRRDPHALQPEADDFPATARRWETGTPPIPAVYAAVAGLRLITGLDLRQVRQHVTGLVDLAARQLAGHGEQLRLSPDEHARGAHLAVVDPAPQRLTEWLAARRILIAPRGDVARIAFHAFNTRDDVAHVCALISQYRRATRRHRP